MHFFGLFLIYLTLSSLVAGDSVFLDLPQRQKQGYVGFLWLNSNAIQMIPKLHAITSSSSSSGRICGFNVIADDLHSFPFIIELLGDGYAQVLLNDEKVKRLGGDLAASYAFEIEAFDCDPNPNVSNRLPVVIHVKKDAGPLFPDAQYEFFVSEFSPVGLVVGQVTAMEQPGSTVPSGVCSYAILSNGIVPFTIDPRGVLRLKTSLTAAKPLNDVYEFRVQAKDCNLSEPKEAFTRVSVQLIRQQCRPGWTDVPKRLEYDNEALIPGLLFWPNNMQLSTCEQQCPFKNIRLGLSLASPVEFEHRVDYANSEQCAHDAQALRAQQRICHIDPDTDLNLLPDPDRDLSEQISMQVIGRLPQLAGPARAWRFSSAEGSIWNVAFDQLYGYKAAGGMPKSAVFASGFSLSFWLKRELDTKAKTEEVIITSHDQQTNQELITVSLIGCHLIVKVRVQLGQSSSTNQLMRWTYENLPATVCNSDWHHFALTYNPAIHPLSPEALALLIDGEKSSRIELPRDDMEPNESARYSSEDISLSIGAAYERGTRKVMKGLNGQLAGLTLLLRHLEAPNVLACLAKCGEGLLLPQVRDLLLQGSVVDIEPNRIQIESLAGVEQAIDLLSGVAYTRSDPLERLSTLEKRVPLSRVLHLTTTYTCADGEKLYIPDVLIDLVVMPVRSIESILDANRPTHSLWVPEKPEAPRQPSNAITFKSDRTFVARYPPSDSGVAVFPNLAVDASDEESMLDECLVTPLSPNGLDTGRNEHISWSNDAVQAANLTVVADNYAVRLKGRASAKNYIRALNHVRYFAPSDLRPSADASSDPSQELEVYAISFNLVCLQTNRPETTTGDLTTKLVLKMSREYFKKLPSFGLSKLQRASSNRFDREDVEDYARNSYFREMNELSKYKNSLEEPTNHMNNGHGASKNLWVIILGVALGFLCLAAIVSGLVYRARSGKATYKLPPGHLKKSSTKVNRILEQQPQIRKGGDRLLSRNVLHLRDNPLPDGFPDYDNLSPMILPVKADRHALGSIKSLFAETEQSSSLLTNLSRQPYEERSFNGIYEEPGPIYSDNLYQSTQLEHDQLMGMMYQERTMESYLYPDNSTNAEDLAQKPNAVQPEEDSANMLM